ncbi:MAG: hypothetical protein HS111_19410 [Kofleriaceae bacterium]|nr:hypothetical protein [Kofleriaceae bacterium]
MRLHQRKTRKEALAVAAEIFRLVGIPSPEERLANYTAPDVGRMVAARMIAMALGLPP